MDEHMNGRMLERTNAQKDRRTDRGIHARRDIWTHGQTHRHTDVGMDAHMNGQTLERTNAPKDRRTDRRIHARRNAWTDAPTHGRREGRTHEQTDT